MSTLFNNISEVLATALASPLHLCTLCTVQYITTHVTQPQLVGESMLFLLLTLRINVSNTVFLPRVMNKISSITCSLKGTRRRMETESKAKCRRFGMGSKIECHTGNFGVIVHMCSIVYIAVVHFPFTFVGGRVYVCTVLQQTVLCTHLYICTVGWDEIGLFCEF